MARDVSIVNQAGQNLKLMKNKRCYSLVWLPAGAWSHMCHMAEAIESAGLPHEPDVAMTSLFHSGRLGHGVSDQRC